MARKRPVRDMASAIEAFVEGLDSGRAIQVKASVKQILAGDWGGLEFRFAPPELDEGSGAEATGDGGN